MVLRISKRFLMITACTVLSAVVVCFALPCFVRLPPKPPPQMLAGGTLYSPAYNFDLAIPVVNQREDMSSERFQRPSKDPPYPNRYSFKDFEKSDAHPPLITKKFDNPEDVVLAYYGILQSASNMVGYSGGCGSVGWSTLPYPYAYELLTKEKQKEMPLDRFVASFNGMGYITLLKLLPAYASAGTPRHTQYYMVEIEVITGAKTDPGQQYHQGSQFAYYYGLVAAEQTPGDGWKIGEVRYIAEDFLCAPMHGWFYLSDAVVQIVYRDNLKLIDEIDKIEQEEAMIRIYASGKEKHYRFDFVRLTNGYDILLHEYILSNGQWKETGLLTDSWKNLKLTVENNKLREAV